MTRRVCYVSGTRADFGLMRQTLLTIQSHGALALQVIVTGMHLSQLHGMTVTEIEATTLPILARVPVALEPATGATMARNLGLMTTRFTELLDTDKPDVLLLLGDRAEMMAGAIAALHLNIATLHVHGGERSGTVDEPVRHAISKLAQYHAVATAASRERLLRMGEHDDAVFVTGAPGLDGLVASVREDRAALCREVQLDATRPLALLVFHPVLAEADDSARATRAILAALAERGMQVLALMPNADAGSTAIREVLSSASADAAMRLLTHLPRERFAAWMAACDVMVGNSSAGIIEAASFGTPVLNLGSRQNLRERNANVIDAPLEAASIALAIDTLCRHGRYPRHNLYGDGHAAARIADLLASVPTGAQLRPKTNAY